MGVCVCVCVYFKLYVGVCACVFMCVQEEQQQISAMQEQRLHKQELSLQKKDSGVRVQELRINQKKIELYEG